MTPGRPLTCSSAEARVYDWEELISELGGGLIGPPIHLHLVRHAQSIANARGLVAGQSNVDLSFRGYVQALTLGFRLERSYDIVYVSALGRAYRTIQVAQAARLRRVSKFPVSVDARLNERDLGDLEGAPNRRIAAYAEGDLTYAPNGGESYLDLARRLLSFLVDLRRDVSDSCRVAIATHVGPMRLLVGIIEGLDDPRSVLALHFANAATYRGVLRDLRWPAFIRRGAIFERCREKVGAAFGAPYHT